MLDVHTHNTDARNAVISCNPWEFQPHDGLIYSVGIHPWHSAEVTDEQIAELRRVIEHPSVVAVGECGIDALRGAEIIRQRELTTLHAKLAETAGKPLILHCVRASHLIVKLYKELKPHQPWIIHGFRGSIGTAKALLSCKGIYLSFGEKFNPQALAIVPIDRILVETDESSLPISEIAAIVAAARGITIDTLSQSAGLLSIPQPPR